MTAKKQTPLAPKGAALKKPAPSHIEVADKPVSKLLAGAGALVWARRPFDYDTGMSLDRGQFFNMRNSRNDEKLVRLGYVEEVKGESADALECPECGGLFVDEFTRGGHIKARHVQFYRKRTPREEDSDLENQDRLLEAHAPLYLENTAASRR